MLKLTAGTGRPRLLHGADGTVWPLLRMAIAAGLSIRVGLEDGDRLPDGSRAADNAALIASAYALLPGAYACLTLKPRRRTPIADAKRPPRQTQADDRRTADHCR